jgi:oligoendopeptidase F
MAREDIAWDLSEIFPSSADPSVQKAIDSLGKTAEHLKKEYERKIGRLSAKGLAECLEEFEAYRAKLGDASLFAELSFAANMTLPDAQSLHDKATKTSAKDSCPSAAGLMHYDPDFLGLLRT